MSRASEEGHPLLPAPAATAATGVGDVASAAGGEPAGKRQVNALSRAQQRTLEDWLANRWERVERTHPSQRVVAAHATVELGFPVTTGNVRGATRALGKTWPPSPAAATYVKTEALRRGLRTVARNLVAMYQRLGMDFDDPDLAALADLNPPLATNHDRPR